MDRIPSLGVKPTVTDLKFLQLVNNWFDWIRRSTFNNTTIRAVQNDKFQSGVIKLLSHQTIAMKMSRVEEA